MDDMGFGALVDALVGGGLGGVGGATAAARFGGPWWTVPIGAVGGAVIGFHLGLIWSLR